MGPEDDGYIGYVLSDVARLMRTVFDRRVRDIGLTRAQWLVLTRLYRRPGASQTELSEMLEIDRASAGRMIDRMEKGGWLERRADGTDRRVKRLHLTTEARRVHADMWAIAEATVDDALAPLSAAERDPVHATGGPREGTAPGPGRDDLAMSRSRQTLPRLVLLVVMPLLAVAGGAYWWLSGGRYIVTENAYVKAHIVQIAPEVSGQVRRVPVRDHATVAAGDVLLTIESRPFRLALDSAEAELDTARTHVETLRATWREAVSELADAEARAAHFQRQHQRQEELATKGVLSASKRDESLNETRAAADRVVTVREKLRRVLTALNGDPEMPADQHPMVRERSAARERAALDLARTTVRAPVDGVVVNLRLQRGEQIKASTPLFALVDLSRPWVEANFKETELTHVRVGQKARIVLDTYPDSAWEALVESVSPATGAEFAILPPQNASGNWVKVVQRLPVKLRLLPHQGEPPLRAGMTATVSIDTGRQRSVGSVAQLFGGRGAAAGDATARTD